MNGLLVKRIMANGKLLEELRTKAKNAGIEKMIDDINEQLKEAQK